MTTVNVTSDLLRMQGTKVFVAGDAMLDEYVMGSVGRVSPEAPVPVVLEEERRAVLGGAANVAANVARLGAQAHLAARIGEDDAAHELRVLGEAAGLELTGLVVEAGPTARKTRIVAGYQQLVRVDRERTEPLRADSAAALVAAFESFAVGPGDKVLVLADYAKGTLTPEVLRALIDSARSHGIPVVVDPKSTDLRRYAGASVLKPNLAEGRAAVARLHPEEHDPDIEEICQAVLELSKVENVVLSCSADGVAAAGADLDGTLHMQAHTLQVADVSGAGDTMVAFLGMAVAAGLPLPRAVELSNVAAGAACEKLGTATISPGEFLAAFKLVSEASSPEKILDRDEATRVAFQLRAEGRRIAFANGCFDLLHAGHVTLLHRARAFGDALMVGLNSDDGVRRLKGEGRPLQSLEDRSAVLASLAAVDFIVSFDEDTPLELILAVRPDVIVKGGDYAPEEVVGGREAASWGGRVEIVPLVEGRSTSRLIETSANR